jgi:hypothetical protein
MARWHGVVVDLGGGHPMLGRGTWLCCRVASGEVGYVGISWVSSESNAHLYVGVGNGSTLGCRLPRWGRCCSALEPPFEVLWVKTQFRLSWWATTTFICCVLLEGIVLEASNHVRVVVGCWTSCGHCLRVGVLCFLSLFLKVFWSWLRFGSLDVYRCLPLVSSFVILEACLGCSAGCNLFYIFLIFSLLMKYLSMHILKKGS